jgi:oligoendopeptidase F
MSSYTFDLQQHFFSSLEAEKAELVAYYQSLAELEKLKGNVSATAGNLLHALVLYDNIQLQFLRHYIYHYLRYAINTLDIESKAAFTALDAGFEERTSFLRVELRSIDLPMLTRYLEEQPDLETYHFAIESAHRYHLHALSTKAESILGSTAPLINGWQYDLYEILIRHTEFGEVKTQEGELDVFRQRTVIANHPEHTVRQAGFEQLYEGYYGQRELYAFALINLVKARNQKAQLHQFYDAPSEVYFDNYWSKQEVTHLLEHIEQHIGIYRHYQHLCAEHARIVLRLEQVNIWDVPTSSPGEIVPRFSIEEASQIILKAVSPLGSEYADVLANLLDPVNGRMDILPGKYRKSGGFSKGFPGITSVFFSGGFEGYYHDVRVLMHESTHAVHRQLMSNHHIRPAYAQGPHYLFESFAILNELLLADYLYQHEVDPAKRRFYLERFFDGKGMALYFTAQDAALEQAIYDGVEAGRVQTADDLDALAGQTLGRFDIWVARHEQLKMRWITNRLFYEDPLYVINYVFGSLLALKYYAMYLQAPVSFAQHYIALMSNGFDDTPARLLKKYLSIDLHDPRMIEAAVGLLDKKVSLLEKEYLDVQL